MRIGIGIDTGGTCTDAVAYDFDSSKLLAKGKALTTRHDLSLGIGQALDMLPQEYIRDASIIALSTTLATNACVENKGCRAKLLIFGLTDELISRYKAESKYGFNRESVRCIDIHGSADGLSATAPDWEAVAAELDGWLSGADALAIAELYSASNGAPCEKHAKKLFSERLGLSCIGASELTGELDVLARGATALLNARLFPVVWEFVDAALSGFSKRGCNAPVMVVRSDGSLMSSELTRSRPVETILSGPAASVLAGKGFTKEEDCLIIDMGGTTTDVSVICAGRPLTADEGISIGGWKTHVKGVFVDTFALGGDSTVRVKDGKLRLFPRRAASVCSATRRWPQIKTMLAALLDRKHINQFPLHEFYYLVREPAEPERYDSDELSLINALGSGPCMLGDLNARAGIDLYHLDSERLESEGVVMRCGLTPTDFMHIKGDYTEYDAEASVLAARFLLLMLGREDSPAEVLRLADEVYDMVEGFLYENLLRILLERQYPAMFKNGAGEQTAFLIREGWLNRHTDDPVLFGHTFSTKAALIGVGAPTHVFLPNAAKALNAKCILPEHAEVANAVGALMAEIRASVRVDISQKLSSSGGLTYIVHAPDGSAEFTSYDDAAKTAMAAAEAAAKKEARARGAMGRLKVNTYVNRNTTVSNWGSSVSLGGTAVSEAASCFE